MRAPTRLIDPASAGVSIGTRLPSASAASTGRIACAAGAAGAVAVGSALGWPCAAGVAVGVPLAPATVVVTSGLAGVGKNCAETKFQPSRMATDNNIAAIRLRLSSTLLGLSSSQNVGE